MILALTVLIPDKVENQYKFFISTPLNGTQEGLMNKAYIRPSPEMQHSQV